MHNPNNEVIPSLTNETQSTTRKIQIKIGRGALIAIPPSISPNQQRSRYSSSGSSSPTKLRRERETDRPQSNRPVTAAMTCSSLWRTEAVQSDKATAKLPKCSPTR